MANSKGPANIRNMMYNGKNPLLPPKSPFPSIAPSYAEYIPSSSILPKSLPNHREGNSHHHRTSSESCLIEEQPSWLDDLLDEPETPVRKGGHRRSSSDSFAYADSVNVVSMNYVAQDDNKFKNLTPVSVWGSQDFDMCRNVRQSSFFPEQNFPNKGRIKPWDSPVNSVVHPRGLTSPRDYSAISNQGSFRNSQDGDRTDKHVYVESGDVKGSNEKMDASQAKSSETDTKRAKQQFAQRSRVRKLQYIAELERNVQALQAEGSEVSAELEFLNQQNLILSMENKALKQRLESLSQEQLLKYVEHDVLERELGRLRNLYNQQQQPPPPQQQQQTPTNHHRRVNSRDLDQHFASLSLKPKDAATSSTGGQLHI